MHAIHSSANYSAAFNATSHPDRAANWALPDIVEGISCLFPAESACSRFIAVEEEGHTILNSPSDSIDDILKHISADDFCDTKSTLAFFNSLNHDDKKEFLAYHFFFDDIKDCKNNKNIFIRFYKKINLVFLFNPNESIFSDISLPLVIAHEFGHILDMKDDSDYERSMLRYERVADAFATLLHLQWFPKDIDSVKSLADMRKRGIIDNPHKYKGHDTADVIEHCIERHLNGAYRDIVPQQLLATARQAANDVYARKERSWLSRLFTSPHAKAQRAAVLPRR